MQKRTSESAPVKHLPLDDVHRKAGAKMVPFAGFEMPLQYQSVKTEWEAVRNRCGLFDVSHMGKIIVKGPTALLTLDHLLTNDVSGLSEGCARYSLMCTTEGTVIDDLIVYRSSEDSFLLVVNGSRKDVDFSWMKSHAFEGTEFVDISRECALFALQGPNAESILDELGQHTHRKLAYYSFSTKFTGEYPLLVARLGYTGEDGFEIMCMAYQAEKVWKALCEAGQKHGLSLCGLAVRDTLRLEAGMPLYGKDLDEKRTPFDAGLDRFVKLDKPDFIGRGALAKQRRKGIVWPLTGFTCGIPMHVPEKSLAGKSGVDCTLGIVTSSVISPQFGGIGMMYLDSAYAKPGTKVEVFAKNRWITVLTSALPFFSRKRPQRKEG